MSSLVARWFFPCALVSLSAGLAAQAVHGTWTPQLTPCLPFEPENSIDWPTGAEYGDPAAFGRALVLELNGDGSSDAVVLAGGKVVALWDPYVYDALTPISSLTGVVDIAVLPILGPETKDVLLVTNSTGLLSLTANDYTFSAPGVVARGNWIGAGPLHVDDLDGDGVDDIIGVEASHLAVHTRLGNGSGFPAGPSFPLGVQVFDALSIDWANDGTRELAVLASDGLHVYSLLGAPPILVPRVSTFGKLARIEDELSIEVLAWVRDATGGAELVVLNDTLQESAQPLTFGSCSIGAFVPTAILAGKYDGDRADELMLVDSSRREAVVLQNLSAQGQPPHFAPADSTAYDIIRLSAAVPGAGGVGIPAFAQLDNEQSDDVLVAVNTSGGHVTVQRALPHFRTGVGLPLSSTDVLMYNTEFTTGAGAGGTPYYGQLRQAIAVPSIYLGFTEAEIRVWQQGGPYTLVNSVAVDRHIHSLARNSSNQTQAAPTQWVAIQYDFPVGACWDNPQYHFYIDLRFRKTNAQGQFIYSPKFVGGFALGTNCDNMVEETYPYLESLGDPDELLGLIQHNGLTGTFLDAETLVGAYLPITAVPPFQNNTSSSGPAYEGLPAHAFP